MWLQHLRILGDSINLGPLPQLSADKQSSFVTNTISIVIATTAAISLLFIVIGGFRYILSQGDPQGVSKAKGTVLYALIGLIVAIAAQVIVLFVLKALS